MARNVTRGELRERLEKLCDIEGNNHISGFEKNEILNSAISEFWDRICNTGISEKYVKVLSFNAVSGQLEYPIEDMFDVEEPNDFYRIHQLYVVENTTQLRSLTRKAPSELLEFKAPQSSVPMKLYYIPIAPVIQNDIEDYTTGDSDEIDGINGWEEFILLVAACRIKFKRDEDYSHFDKRKRELGQRIDSMGMIDFAEPARVSRKRARCRDPWMMYSNSVNAYGVRGDKIELYYLYGYWP